MLSGEGCVINPNRLISKSNKYLLSDMYPVDISHILRRPINFTSFQKYTRTSRVLHLFNDCLAHYLRFLTIVAVKWLDHGIAVKCQLI